MIYCVRCKAKTADVTPVQAVTVKGHPILKATCAVCHGKKAQLLKVSSEVR